MRDQLSPAEFEQLQVEDDPRFIRKAWIAMFCGTVAFWVVVVAGLVMVLS